MKISGKYLLSGGLSLMMAAAVGVTSVISLLNSDKTASAAIVDFDENPTAYNVWDGSSYDFSWYGDGSSKSYEISTAAQLASLSILTNDLSSNEWDDITDSITASDKKYIAAVDDFSGKTITITSDIDLGGHEWLPVSYPWKTASLSGSYEFTNLEGKKVTYNAVDYVPELETVDPWVGDKNGDPISTRYWEFPESEMRFRDLVMPINFESMNELVDGKLENLTGILGVKNTDVLYAENWDYAYTYVKPRDYDYDIIKSYTYKDIQGYTEIPAFSGTINGDSHRIRGISPSIPWTEDTEERLHTYDPIGEAFVSQLGESGSITNLNVQGSYDNEIMSYSAILCAYNYGNISSCYVDGKVINQTLITMIYPTQRVYSPNHDSSYVLSDSEGTVMPVGNSGIVTSQNYGTITDCISGGSVTQAFRQFGGIACTNYGTICDCTNYATVTSSEVQTDFTTDEWSYNGSYTGVESRGSFDNYSFLQFDSGVKERYADLYEDLDSILANYISPVDTVVYYSSPVRADNGALVHAAVETTPSMKQGLNDSLLVSCSTRYKWNIMGLYPNPNGSGYTSNYLLITEGNGTFYQGVTNNNVSIQDSVLWLPGLYETNEGESIAANHLYGNYTLAAVGGICAVNEGTLIGCVNYGDIEALRNITEQSAHNRYGTSDTDKSASDYYSYIRPTTAYGIFSTAVNTVSYASGICAFNSGDVGGCGNHANITYPTGYNTSVDLAADERAAGYYDYIDFIPVTLNNFYQNSVLVGGKVSDSNSCALWALGWWVTEDWIEQYGSDGYNYNGKVLNVEEYFDRNMPYPYTFRYNVSRIGISSGIVCTNIGSVHDIDTAGTAQDSVISVSDGMDSAVDVYNINTTSTERAFRNLTNTNLNDVSVTGADSFAVNLLQRGNVKVESSNIYITDTTDNKAEIVNIEGDNADLFIFNQVSFKKTNEGTGAPLAATITRVTINELVNQSSYGSPGYMDSVKLTNYYVADTNGIQHLLEGINCEIKNVYANVGSADKLCLLEGSTISGVRIYSGGNIPVGEFYSCTMTDFDIFGNNATMTCVDSDISNFISVGDIAANTYTTSGKYDTGNFVYYFRNCTAEDMYLESEIDYTLVGFNQPGFDYNTVPGVVSIINSSNSFTHCSINAPDGVLSYSYLNHLILDEIIDYGILYSDHAARDGAMAYALTGGNRRFTVAVNDVVCQQDAWLEFGLSELQDWCSFAATDLVLPAYTRECLNETEQTYHKISVPYVSYGVGELIISREENGETFSTHAAGEMFPHTDIFAKSGELLTVEIAAEDGYALNGVTEYINMRERELSSEGSKDEPYRITSYSVGDSDVVLVGDWVNVYDIEADTSLSAILDIVPNASAAAKGQQITVSGILKNDNWTIDGFYYICYKTDASNRSVLDPTTKTEISADCRFEMPSAPVKIYANITSNLTDIQRFVISGQEAVITGNNVDLYFDNSIDISNMTVDSYVLSDGAAISPDPYTIRDFSEPVVFTVTSESGQREAQFVVTVYPVEDGEITRFQINGYNGIIDGTDIEVNVPLDMDVSNVRPYVIWSGSSISPDTTSAYNFDNPVTFTVTASDGTTKTYTVTVNKTDALDDPLRSFELDGVLAEIDHINRRVYISYPYGMDVSDITLTDISYIGASASLRAGQPLNLTQAIKLSIVDAGGNVVNYTLIAVEEEPSMIGILQFTLYGQNAVIDDAAGTITIDLPDYYDKSNIAPNVVTFMGKELSPSAVVKQNFNSPVQYTVTSYTGETKTYTVIVK